MRRLTLPPPVAVRLTAMLTVVLIVTLGPGLGLPAQKVDRPEIHRDPIRAFALHLEKGWRLLPLEAAGRLDRDAAMVVRPAGAEGFVAVEARRLPAIALGRWAASWDSRSRPGNALAGRPGMGARYLRVQSFTTREVGAERFVLTSDFHRRGGWAYRVSRYLPFDAANELRELLGRAADGFRLLPEASTPTDTAAIPALAHPDRVLPDGGVVKHGQWARPDIAAALRPPRGWRLAFEPDPTSFLPRDAVISMRDTVNGYRAGLIRLGETIELDDLTARLQAALMIHLKDAAGFNRMRRAGAVRVTCTSRMPKGAMPSGLPLTWLAEGRIVEGQGLAIVVGVTGLGLAADRRRMERAFGAWSRPAAAPAAARAVPMEDGFVFSADPGFRWRWPATWTIRADGEGFGLREEGAIVSACRRGPAPAGDRLPPVRARVYRAPLPYEGPGRGVPPNRNRSVPRPPRPWFEWLGGGTIINHHRLPSPRTRPGRSEWAVLRASEGGREWLRITDESLGAGRDHLVRLISCIPAIARERLGAEQEALHRSFRAVTAREAEHGAVRIDDETFTDALRGIRFRPRGSWVRLLGGHARTIEPRAVAALLRDEGAARFTITAERIPGYSVMRWAAHQRVRLPRRMPDGRLFVEEAEPDGKRKSILATHAGWCLRVDLVLSYRAPARASTEGHAMLRSVKTDLEIEVSDVPAIPADPADLAPGQSVTRGVWRKQGCPAALRIPRGWRILPPREIGRRFPVPVVTALEQPDYGATLVLAEVAGADPQRAAMRLQARLAGRLSGWEAVKTARKTTRGVEFTARALVPGVRAESSLPSTWRARVNRVGGRTFAILTWIRGTPEAADRAMLEAALDALLVSPAGRAGGR